MMGHKARRGRGEGSVFQRADGYWVGSVEIPTTGGKRRKARVVRRYQKDVVAALDDLRARARDGGIPARDRTVAQFLRWWCDEVKANEVSAGSLREYKLRVARVTTELGKVRLGRLAPTHVTQLANTLAANPRLAPSTVRHTLATLRSALRWAVAASLIPRNPAEAVRAPRSGRSAKLEDRLEPAEVRRVLAEAKGDRLEAMWWLALTYGLRLGELLALRWADLDWTAETLTVRKGKTASSARTLPMIPDCKRLLWAHHKAAGIVAIEGYVFTNEAGRPLTDKVVYKQWNRFLRAAGVEHRCRRCGTDAKCSTSVRRFHSSRHTAATTLLERGIPLEVTSAILGHSGLAITADLYGRTRADLIRRALTESENP